MKREFKNDKNGLMFEFEYRTIKGVCDEITGIWLWADECSVHGCIPIPIRTETEKETWIKVLDLHPDCTTFADDYQFTGASA